MDTIHYMPVGTMHPVPQQVGGVPPHPVPAGTLLTTLTIASAVSIGSNIVDVQKGSMTVPHAVLNGVVKGTAATLILENTARNTVLQVAFTASVLASAGYLIDSAMKKNKQNICFTERNPEK